MTIFPWGVAPDRTRAEWLADSVAWLQEDHRRMFPGMTVPPAETLEQDLADEVPSLCLPPEGEDCDRVATEVVFHGAHGRWVCQHHSVKARAAGWITVEQ